MLARLLLSASLLACTPSPPRYETRGVVTARTGAGAETRYAIHHEPIPSFRDREGSAAPMDSMTMMFGLREGVQAEDLAPGTKVSLGFEVHWSGGEALRITRITRLPAETRLDLSEHAHPRRGDAGS